MEAGASEVSAGVPDTVLRAFWGPPSHRQVGTRTARRVPERLLSPRDAQ